MAGNKEGKFDNLRALINNIPDDKKTAAGLYKERLAACKSCDYLSDGMCRACGCYVELRAARNFKDCPHGKW
jgi:hypothetical protein